VPTLPYDCTWPKSKPKAQTQPNQPSREPLTTLRTAERRDCHRLEELYARWVHESGHETGPGLNWTRHHIVVAEDRHGHIVGFGALGVVTIAGKLYTEGHYVYVVPHYRRYFVGYRVYRYLRKVMKRLEHPVLITATVHDYKAWIKRGYRTTFIMMERNP